MQKRSFSRCFNMGKFGAKTLKNSEGDKYGSSLGLISLEPRVGSTWDQHHCADN